MMKISPFFYCCLLCLVVAGCTNSRHDYPDERRRINAVLDEWNAAAAKADYSAYFKSMADDAVFIGTDAKEYWNKKSFMVWTKPYFDRGRAWSFTSMERHVYFDAGGKMAWFDELLNTRMKICRGSGVLVKQADGWKIQQYVLSMTVPNEKTDSVVRMKGPIEDGLIMKLQK
ncbi:MAG: nuclear transport factor 2 family protein [Bacteroidota bacterium]